MSSEPDFDWSQAESLLGDDPGNVPQDMADIALELINDSRQRFQELKQLQPETDRVKISSAAHQLRGSLLNFGFTGVGVLLYKVEKEPYETADYPVLMENAETAFNDSLKLLSSRYPSLQLA